MTKPDDLQHATKGIRTQMDETRQIEAGRLHIFSYIHFLYDYQGFGKSGSTPLLNSMTGDGESAFDYVHHMLGFEPRDIFHHGESIGSGVACSVADSRISDRFAPQYWTGTLCVPGSVR